MEGNRRATQRFSEVVVRELSLPTFPAEGVIDPESTAEICNRIVEFWCENGEDILRGSRC